MRSATIGEISPLHEYWESNQDGDEENRRLIIANKENPSASLFINEPYKWEILFQSTVNAIKNGDKNTINAFTILLNMIKNEDAQKIKTSLIENKIFDELTIQLINSNSPSNSNTIKNKLRFFKILFFIFTNPYNIQLKGKKNHIYEKSGWLINRFKNLLFTRSMIINKQK
tara:strand:+ start:676 stop:1188 length:513 start_codon:yes stop_codon:yes gene_type:complete